MERTWQCVTLGSHMHTKEQLDLFISTLQSLRGERQELAGSAPNLSSSLMTASCWPGSSLRALQREGFFLGPSSSQRRGKETEQQPRSLAFVSLLFSSKAAYGTGGTVLVLPCVNSFHLKSFYMTLGIQVYTIRTEMKHSLIIHYKDICFKAIIC